GPDALVAPEVTVVLEDDPEEGRRLAREFTSRYLQLRNYTGNLLRFGFTERAGSDRLVDAVVPHGPAGQVADAVRAHLEAGADHVCIQVIGHGDAPVED